MKKVKVGRAVRGVRPTVQLVAAVTCLVCGWTASSAPATETVPPAVPPPWQLTPSPLAQERPDISPAVVEAYVEDFGVTEKEAARRLEIQNEGYPYDAALRQELGETYGGISFDNTTGVLVAASTTLAGVEIAERLTAGRGFDRGDVVVRKVDQSLDELEGLQARVEAGLEDEIANAEVTAGIDTAANSVVVSVASNAPASTLAETADVARDSGVRRDVVAPPFTRPQSGACAYPHCAAPLRGGVRIRNDVSSCTSGFMGWSPYAPGQGVLFTAGHCLDPPHPSVWQARRHPNLNLITIGAPQWYDFGSPGDSGLIRTNGQNCGWCPDVASPVIAAWGVDEQWPIYDRAYPANGMYVCRFGSVTQYSCGNVLVINETVTYDGKQVLDTFRTAGCLQEGDSGGPAVSWVYAIGIAVAYSGDCGAPGSTFQSYPIINAEGRLGALTIVAQ